MPVSGNEGFPLRMHFKVSSSYSGTIGDVIKVQFNDYTYPTSAIPQAYIKWHDNHDHRHYPPTEIDTTNRQVIITLNHVFLVPD